MTISSTTNRVSYTGNGATTAFSFPYLFYSNDDLTVILVTTATGAETVQTITTHYTVTGAGVGAGGTVTMLTAPTAAQKLVILREVDYDQQDFDPVDNDPFPAASVEQAVDYTVMMAQQVKEIADRALRFPRGDSTALTSEISAAVNRANKALIFDASGNVTVSTDDYNDQAANAAASAAAASASASAAATSASNASTSASNAATSETNAQTAKTAAETAETNAETAQAAAEAAQAAAEAAAAAAADVAKIEWQGAWSGATAYALNDAVSYGGSSWICVQAHTNQTPADTAYWDPLAVKGTDGTGTVTSIVAGTGLTGGTITTSGTVSLNLGSANTWTASQRATITTDNDLSFDQSVTNNFFCTPSAGGTLTFTNHTAGQSGFILLVNGSNYAITAAATTKINSADLTTISATGTYLLSYLDNGTNAYVVVSKELTS